MFYIVQEVGYDYIVIDSEDLVREKVRPELCYEYIKNHSPKRKVNYTRELFEFSPLEQICMYEGFENIIDKKFPSCNPLLVMGDYSITIEDFTIRYDIAKCDLVLNGRLHIPFKEIDGTYPIKYIYKDTKSSHKYTIVTNLVSRFNNLEIDVYPRYKYIEISYKSR